MTYNFDKYIDRTDSFSVKHSPKIVKMIYGDSKLDPLWVADMDYSSPNEIITALKNFCDRGIFGYSTVLDSEILFSAIINWYSKRQNWIINKDNILYSPGIVTAIHYLIKLNTNKGDGVIVQNPVYAPFRDSINNQKRVVINNQLIEKEKSGLIHYEMDFELLYKQASNPKNKMLILCSPHNPVGRVWKSNELLKVIEICKNTDTLLISDEIHSDLIFPGKEFTPIANLTGNWSNWVTAVAPSKTFNIAGLATSFIVFSDIRMKRKLDKMFKMNSVAHENPLGLVAAVAGYSECEEWVNELNIYNYENYKLIKEMLNNKFSITDMESTYLAWIKTSKINDTESYFYKEKKLAVQRGSDFGPGGEKFVRLNFALPRQKLERILESFI